MLRSKSSKLAIRRRSAGDRDVRSSRVLHLYDEHAWAAPHVVESLGQLLLAEPRKL
jgi:hypothetical protein